MEKSAKIIMIINKFVFPVFTIFCSVGLVFVVLSLANMFTESLEKNDPINSSSLNLTQPTINKITTLKISSENTDSPFSAGNKNPFSN